jgi:hypothetical protein
MIKPVGLFGNSLGWQQILDQEKVNYEIVTGLSNLDRYGVLIITKSPESKEIAEIRDYLEAGGSALTDFSVLKSLLSDFHYRPVKTRYISPTSDAIFNNVSLIDIGQNGFAMPNSNRPNIYFKDYGKGKIIALPFDLNQALLNANAKPKFFYFSSRKFPYETVAEVSKGEIRKLVINCLGVLFKQQNLYYSHLWYYPNTYSTLFTFRVDTDFSPWQQIESVIKLTRENELSFTWFVNTQAQEGDLAKFAKLKNQDLQLHCYTHNVFSDDRRNRNNIEKGKELLKSAGIEPVGFAGPFGEWNENLSQVLEDLGFEYSSEFALAYDDLPFYPLKAGQKSKVLQIPIHPICAGRLLHAGLDFNQIFVYFRRYIDFCYQAREPIMIYDHPHRIHQIPQVFDIIFKKIKSMKNIWLTNFTQLMQWWRQREAITYDASIEKEQLKVMTNSDNPIFSLHIVSPSGQETFVPLKNGVYNLAGLSWSSIPAGVQADPEIESIRKGAFTLQIKEFINTLDRRLKGQRG